MYTNIILPIYFSPNISDTAATILPTFSKAFQKSLLPIVPPILHYKYLSLQQLLQLLFSLKLKYFYPYFLLFITQYLHNLIQYIINLYLLSVSDSKSVFRPFTKVAEKLIFCCFAISSNHFGIVNVFFT